MAEQGLIEQIATLTLDLENLETRIDNEYLTKEDILEEYVTYDYLINDISLVDLTGVNDIFEEYKLEIEIYLQENLDNIETNLNDIVLLMENTNNKIDNMVSKEGLEILENNVKNIEDQSFSVDQAEDLIQRVDDMEGKKMDMNNYNSLIDRINDLSSNYININDVSSWLDYIENVINIQNENIVDNIKNSLTDIVVDVIINNLLISADATFEYEETPNNKIETSLKQAILNSSVIKNIKSDIEKLG
jgi:hypothetical protein